MALRILLPVLFLGLALLAGCSSADSEPPTEQVRAFVANAGDGTVSVLDLEGRVVIATVQVSPGPTGTTSHGVAVDRQGGHFFVGDVPAGVLRVYETVSLEEVAQIDIGIHLHGIDITPGRMIVASGTKMGTETKETVLIDAATFAIEAVLQTDISGHATTHPGGRYVYIADIVDHRMAVIDLDSRTVVNEFFVGPLQWPEGAVGPNELAFSADGTRGYSADYGAQTISVIDTSNPEAPILLQLIGLEELPHGVEATADGKSLWVANRGSRDIAVLDLETQEVQARISVAPYSTNHVALSPDGRYAYATVTAAEGAASLTGYLVILDTTTFAEVTRIALGITPHEISLAH